MVCVWAGKAPDFAASVCRHHSPFKWVPTATPALSSLFKRLLGLKETLCAGEGATGQVWGSFGSSPIRLNTTITDWLVKKKHWVQRQTYHCWSVHITFWKHQAQSGPRLRHSWHVKRRGELHFLSAAKQEQNERRDVHTNEQSSIFLLLEHFSVMGALTNFGDSVKTISWILALSLNTPEFNPLAK